VLRHTAAMNLLHAGVDSTVIALWLGHESVEATQIYIHADMTIKERALAGGRTRHEAGPLPATGPAARVSRGPLIMRSLEPSGPVVIDGLGNHSA